MKPTSTRAGALAVAAVLTLAVAACGTSGGDDGAATATTTSVAEQISTTTAGATTTEPAQDGEAEARARAMAVVLDESDFPAGWSSRAPDTSDDEGGVAQCSPGYDGDRGVLASFTDDDYVEGDVDAGDGSQFSLETKVFADADTASEAIAPFGDEDVLRCIDAKLTASLESGGATVAGSLGPDDGYAVTMADEAVGASSRYRLTNPSDPSDTTTVTVAVLVLRTNDLASKVTVMSIGDGLDPSDLEAALAKVERLQAA